MKKLYYLLCVAIVFFACSTEIDGDIEKPCYEVSDVAVWTDAVIPYYFDERMPEAEKKTIQSAIDWYEENTVLSFVEYSEDEFFYLPNGVYIKYTGAVQSSYFPYGMGDYITDFRVGKDIDTTSALHETGHVAGLPHEQQRADRDENVIVHEDNIDKEWLGNFEISAIDFVTPYDPTSIMHYEYDAAAIDISKPTMEMKDGREIKPSKIPTQLDIEKINEKYCNELNN